MGDVPVVEVPCGSCVACCRNQVIHLFPERGDYVASYETRLAQNPILGHVGHALKQKPDGSCIYLGEGGCTIHDRRPTMCKAYSCVKQYLETPRPVRRRMERNVPYDKVLFARGRELAVKMGLSK